MWPRPADAACSGRWQHQYRAGRFSGAELIANWRLTTARDQTVDEYGILTRDLFTLASLDPA